MMDEWMDGWMEGEGREVRKESKKGEEGDFTFSQDNPFIQSLN